jgi:hypothetical protein
MNHDDVTLTKHLQKKLKNPAKFYKMREHPRKGEKSRQGPKSR